MAPGKKDEAADRGWLAVLRAAAAVMTDRNDFRRNLIVNIGLFAVGVYIARNLSDIDLMAPQPIQ
ncbi:mitochondrial import receptor subunit TOM6 homolog [Hypanus sabinus]|uniref:mitochondrial import receptor subunit TOM6 homolog n=1 Tax=Hypanus sabinus TaxID=79690 RepID=UPI0028C4999D|nr:mitochondrial import receptor subunit TOM6 homolog [Hypanus sabinus]